MNRHDLVVSPGVYPAIKGPRTTLRGAHRHTHTQTHKGRRTKTRAARENTTTQRTTDQPTETQVTDDKLLYINKLYTQYNANSGKHVACTE